MPLDIKVPLKPLLQRRNCKVKESYMRLYEHHIEYLMYATFEEQNEETLEWVDKLSNWRWARLRKDLSSIEMGYDNKEDVYFIEIEFCGVSNSIAIHYDKKSEAIEIFTILQNYFLSTIK